MSSHGIGGRKDSGPCRQAAHHAGLRNTDPLLLHCLLEKELSLKNV